MNKINKDLNGNTNNTVVLTNSEFFLENNPKGYMTKENFLEYINRFDYIDGKHFIETLGYTRQNCKLINRSERVFNKMGCKDVIWFELVINPTIKRRLLYNEEIMKFLIDCQCERLNHNFDLDGLIVEAEKKKPIDYNPQVNFFEGGDYDEFGNELLNIREISLSDSAMINIDMEDYL